jgi:hypothetical protein
MDAADMPEPAGEPEVVEASTDARGRHVMTHQQLVAVIDGVICEHRTGISRGGPEILGMELTPVPDDAASSRP